MKIALWFMGIAVTVITLMILITKAMALISMQNDMAVIVGIGIIILVIAGIIVIVSQIVKKLLK